MLRNLWLRTLTRRWFVRPSSSSSKCRTALRHVSLELESLEDRLLLSVYAVINTNDSGAGSLRQAILDANADTTQANTIIFDIKGQGPQTIRPLSVLPTITNPVTIDATFQPGYSGTPLIELAGNLAGSHVNGLTITAGNSVVRGLDIDRFGGDGIQLLTNGNDTIQGNFIGTDVTGTLALGNGAAGVAAIEVSNNTIGGTAAGQGNLISGNSGSGILLGGDGNLVQGNLIGTDSTGTAPLGNGDGVAISLGSNNTIGGTGAGAGNVISANRGEGVNIGGFSNQVQGNFIGTDATGMTALGNGDSGVFLFGAGNTVGGSVAGAGNLISGNLGDGVIVRNNASQVQGNLIGTDATGSRALANAGNGVNILDSANLIGGTTPEARNVISGNGLAGIAITSFGFSDRNQVQGNYIGTDITGTKAVGNSGGGVSIFGGTANNTIGGTAAGAGNVISGNQGEGISITANNNQVLGNFIGTNASGTVALGNFVGVRVSNLASNNTIGGTVPGAGNVISGNRNNGVELDQGATGNLVQGNRIGTDVTGAAALGNGGVGIAIAASGNTVGGTAAGAGNLISGNALAGISITGIFATGNQVQGNRIGTDVTGTTAVGNTVGVSIATGASGNLIGGTAAGAGNVISGNLGDGVDIAGANNFVQGNLIGTDITDTHALGNAGSSGVSITGSNNTIGGTDAGARNVISGNQGNGVTVLGGNTNLVEGNYIGTDVTGSTALGNRLNGVEVDSGASNVTIGGTATGAGNVISGNQLSGVLLKGVFPPTNISTGNVVVGNKIGTDATGTSALGNHKFGVEIPNSSGNTVGGTTVGARNIISGNAFAGVSITGSGNAIQGNFIGTDVTGTIALGNGRDGVDVTGTTGNTIGGTTAGAGNLISGNSGQGVVLFVASGNLVQGNDIGTDVTGSVALGNQFAGIDSEQGSNNTIGGTAVGARNIISGNGADGVIIDLGSGNLVEGNYIGTAATGTAAIGNGASGITLTSSGNTVGGTAAGAGNLISGNGQGGVDLDGSTDLLEGNYIGTDVTGTAALGNGGYGVSIFSRTNNTIGGIAAGARNLISGNLGDGIELLSGGGNVVAGNYVGTDAMGTAALGNGGDGVDILGSSNNTIGGAAPGAGNLISGNHGDGVFLNDVYDIPTGNILQGNLIGTDATGTRALANAGNGIDINRGMSNTIGGTITAARNLISGNQLAGVYFDNGAQNVVAGNYVGTDAAGAAALGNGGDGIDVLGSSNNTIGGAASGAGNLISGNHGDGIFLDVASNGANATSNLIAGNFIGTDISGATALGNVTGVSLLNGANNNTIGGTTAGARNLISGNQGDGILISGGTGNVVEGDYIGTDAQGTSALANGQNGIDLANSSNDLIGGTAAGAGNLVSGNHNDGLLSLHDTGLVVQGNLVGTDFTGTVALGNGLNVTDLGNNGGLELRADTNDTIGGTTPEARNLISGNFDYGILDFASSLLVTGNFIGTDITGTKALGNFFGLIADAARNTTIGGLQAGAGNLISGNLGPAIDMFYGQGNVVQGNYIGTDVTGTQALGNGGNGVNLQFEINDRVGGAEAGAGNLISANGGSGVSLANNDSGMLVQGNLIGTDVTGTKALGNAGNGVYLVGGVTNSTIGGTTAEARNLISGNGADGVLIGTSSPIMATSSGILVEGNLIGTDITGTVALGNAGNGVEVNVSASNTVGGAAAGAGNLISGNGQNGILLSSFQSYGTSGNIVQNNRIGTDITGTKALGNGQNGLEFFGGVNHSTIGGTAADAGNVISGNNANGIFMMGDPSGATPSANLFQGNLIGTDITGKLALANKGDGVDIEGGPHNTIGGTTTGAGNVISGNFQFGVVLASPNNLVQGNLIGTDITGTQALGNGGNGVSITGSNNTIGGTDAGVGNTIAFNGNDGVLVDTGTGNAILSDLIFANGNLGIELINNGNNNQAAPRLLSAVETASGTTIVGRLRSTSNTTFTLQFFSDPSPDPSGLGEGQQLLGTFTVTTNPAGIATFVITVPTRVPAGQIITATATDPNNNTSEFSSPVEVKEGLRSSDTYYSNGNVFHRIYLADGSSTATLTNSSGVLLDDYSYNAQGQLTAYDTYYSNGDVFHRVYASDGSSTATLTDNNGNLLQTYNYNAQGQLTSIDYTNGHVYARVHASDGSSTATLTNSSGTFLAAYNYNSQGQLSSIVYANGNVLTYNYTNGVASAALLTNSRGMLLQTYTYNAQGQISSITYNTNGNTLTYNYSNGVLATATLKNSSGATLQTYNYNAQGQITTIDDGSGNLLYTYTYDALGRIATLTYASNGNVLTFTYNSDGTSSARLDTSGGTPIATYHYDVFGRVTEIDYANGNTYTRSYAANGTSTATLTNSSGTVIETYTYDAQGNLTEHNP